MSIFRKKKTTEIRTEMARHLKTPDLVLLGLGSMVGTGIFTVTGTGAANYAGPALMISIVLAAVIVGISGLFFAEFASRVPSTGGVYGYLYATLGEFPAWLAGWYFILEFLIAIASVASGWGSYLKGLLANFGITLPQALSGTFNPANGQYIDIMPVFVLILVTGIVLFNSKIALRFNGFLVLLKFSALALFIILGFRHIDVANWSEFAPFGFGQVYGGQTGIMAGASLMFFAFLGFESISVAVDEVKNPQRTVPRGIVFSLIIVTILYILVTLVLTGLVHYTKLDVSDAVAFALRQVGLNWAANYVSVVAIATLITVCISMTYALARIIYSISRDGLLPSFLSQLTPKNHVPRNATVMVGLAAMIAAGVFPLSSLAEFVNICTFAYLMILPIGILKLRKEEGKPKAGQFKTPLVPFLPIFSIIIYLSFVSQYQLTTWVAFILASFIGISIYYGFGRHHSILNKKSQ